MVLLQSVLCDIDFNDSESYRGTSYLPFLGFMVFFAGMMIAFIGIVKISNSRHQWNIFYDERDRKDLKSPAVSYIETPCRDWAMVWCRWSVESLNWWQEPELSCWLWEL